MESPENGIRLTVRIGYDGSVHKTFRGADAGKRFGNEQRVLKFLEKQDCPFVPQVLEAHEDQQRLVTTNCGDAVERLGEKETQEIFDELERDYRVRHGDPCLRNLTYSPHLNRFCVINFEEAELLV